MLWDWSAYRPWYSFDGIYYKFNAFIVFSKSSNAIQRLETLFFVVVCVFLCVCFCQSLQSLDHCRNLVSNKIIPKNTHIAWPGQHIKMWWTDRQANIQTERLTAEREVTLIYQPAYEGKTTNYLQLFGHNQLTSYKAACPRLCTQCKTAVLHPSEGKKGHSMYEQLNTMVMYQYIYIFIDLNTIKFMAHAMNWKLTTKYCIILLTRGLQQCSCINIKKRTMKINEADQILIW